MSKRADRKVRHLHRDFLVSEAQYEAAQRFWAELLDEVQHESGGKNEWSEWIPKKFADGTLMPRDGNPIFDARSNRLRRAIRVIQTSPTADDVEIAAWMEKLDHEGPAGASYTEELTINCALSEEAASIARALIREWMKEGTSYAAMEDFIQDALADISD
jgi:hypothetical protein